MKTVIEMAREAEIGGGYGYKIRNELSKLELFAELVRADERARMAEKPAQEDPCPGCRKGGVCRTPKCGRLNLPVNHPFRSEQPAQTATYTCGVCGVPMQMEQPAQQQSAERVEPVAWETFALKFAKGKKLSYEKPKNLPKYLDCRPLYTSPPAQRKEDK